MSFLKAEWRKLVLANYSIDKKILAEHLPYGTELDLYDGKCYVSLVGFKFVNTKLLGIKIPFHTNFEEVNLRFYVKRFDGDQWKRGVVFIKEIVPRRALTFVANTVYNENYETMHMEHSWTTAENHRTIEYKWKKKGRWHKINVEASLDKFPIEENSETEFITEHYWGYSQGRGKTIEYEVEHPQWQVREIADLQVDVDFGATYGDAFAFLNDVAPAHAQYAIGSDVSVSMPGTL